MSSGQDVQAIIQALHDANAVRYFTGMCFLLSPYHVLKLHHSNWSRMYAL